MKLIIGIPTINRADLLNEALEKYFEDFKDTEIFTVHIAIEDNVSVLVDASLRTNINSAGIYKHLL